MVGEEPRVVIFTCSWGAHECLLAAGQQHLHLPAGARPLKLDCLGQVGAAVILKAFEKGADGVMLVGCTPEECHYEFGSRRAAEVFEEVQGLARLLGIAERRMEFQQVRAGEATDLIDSVTAFVTRLGNHVARPAASDP